MELYTLNLDTYYVESVVEGYSSLIWTERYREPGDFELTFELTADSKSPDFQLGLAQGMLLGIRDSEECMVIEERSIDVEEDGSATVVYKGRSFETILENRIARPAKPTTTDTGTVYLYPQPLNQQDKDKTIDWKFSNWTTARIADTLIQYWTNSAIVQNTNPAFSLLRIENYECAYGDLDSVLPKRTVVIQPGTIYQRVAELLEMDDLGLRNRRPSDINGTDYLLTIIHNGVDRSQTIAFSSAAGHFRKEKYLESSKDTYNRVFEFTYWRADSYSKYSVWDQFVRVGYLDSTDLKVASTDSVADRNDEVYTMSDRAESFLNAHRPKTLFQCEVSFDIPYKYGVDYGIGDIVKVIANFGFYDKMRVTEFVRIDDEEGERSYPTLEQLAPVAPTV